MASVWSKTHTFDEFWPKWPPDRSERFQMTIFGGRFSSDGFPVTVPVPRRGPGAGPGADAFGIPPPFGHLHVFHF